MYFVILTFNNDPFYVLIISRQPNPETKDKDRKRGAVEKHLEKTRQRRSISGENLTPQNTFFECWCFF